MKVTNVIAAILMLLCGGCSWLYSDYSVKDLRVNGDSNYAQLVSGLNAMTPSLIPNKCLGEVLSTDDTGCRQLRHQAIAILILESEAECVSHRKTIYGNDNAFNITSGSFTNLFSGWSAVAPGERGKSVLSSLALLSNSERSLVNETVYRTVLVPAVDKKIQQTRAEKAIAINNNLSKSMAEYPFVRALSDVIDFHYACSFMSGLQRALEEGNQETVKQKLARLEDTRRNMELELTTNCTSAKMTVDTTVSTICTLVIERHKSISDQIKGLQAQ